MACESVTRSSALVSLAVRRPVLASVAALALVLGASGCSTLDPNAASVNGEEISRRDFEDDLHELRDNNDYVDASVASGQQVAGSLTNSVSTDFAANELTNRIFASLIHEELAARRLTVDPAVADIAGELAPQATFPGAQGAAETYQQLPADFQSRVETETSERLTLALALNDTSLDELGEGPVGGVRNGQQVCVLAIPTATEEDAQAALDELSGGADFATVAATHSIDAQLAQTGGQLRLADGTCPSGEQLLSLGEEFVAALDEAEYGTDVGPLEVQGAFVVARVEVDPLPQLLSLSRPDNPAFGEWLTATMADAKIAVDPRYGRWDPAAGGVVSPASDTPTTVAS